MGQCELDGRVDGVDVLHEVVQAFHRPTPEHNYVIRNHLQNLMGLVPSPCLKAFLIISESFFLAINRLL